VATRPGEINADVGVNINEKGMAGALGTLKQQIASIIIDLNKAGAAAEKAIAAGGKAGAIAAQQINNQIKSLNQVQGNMSKLQGANARNLFGDFTDGNKIGKIAAGMDKFFRGLEGGSPTIEKLTSRLQMMNLQAAKLLGEGQRVSRNFWDRRLAVSEALDAFKKIEAAQIRFRDRMANLSPEARGKIGSRITSYETALSQFDRLAANPRSSGALTAQLNILKTMSAEIDKQLKLHERDDAVSKRLLETTRARALALLSVGAEERRMQMVAGANRFSTLLGGARGGGQFNDVIGSPVPNFRTTGQEAFTRATAAAARAQIMLNSALNSNAGAERIQQLISRYERLQTMQQQSLALAERENKVGFFGGIAQGFKTVTREQSGGAGGLGGIGNLVGRVAAFTVAFRSIQAVTSALRDAAGFAVEFEDKLAQLQAISGSTGLEMEKLSGSILSVAKNSANTIMEVAESAQILAQAGYSAVETSTLLQNVINISAASGATPAESVDILTSALGAFQLQVSDSTHISDALVTTLNDTKLAVGQVQLGLQYLGATAKENNLTFEDLVAILGTAADAGIRSGSTAATGTRQMFIDLQEPSKKLVEELTKIGLTMGDVDVKTRGVIPVLQTLRENGFDAFGALETRAAAMYQVLAENTDKMVQLRDGTIRQGTAADAAAKRMDSLNVQWVQFKNNLMAAATGLGNAVLPLLKELVYTLNNVFDALSLVVKPIVDFNEASKEWLRSISDMTGGWLIAAQSSDDLNKRVDETNTYLNEQEAKSRTLKEGIHSLESEVSNLIARYASLSKNTGDTAYETQRLTERFPGLRAELDKTKGGIDGLIEATFRLGEQMRRALADQTNLQIAAAETNSTVQRQRLLATRRELGDKYPAGMPPTSVRGQERKILELLSGQNFEQYGLKSIEAARSMGKELLAAFSANDKIDAQERQRFYADMNKLISQQGALGSTLNSLQHSYSAADRYRSMTQGNRPLFSQNVITDEAQANATISRVQGLGLSQRRAAIAPELKDAEQHLSEMLVDISYLAKQGDKVAIDLMNEMVRQQKVTIRRLKQAGSANEEEVKAAAREAKTPLGPKSVAVAAALVNQGIRITSAVRSWEEQNNLYRTLPRGQAANPNNAPHVQKRAVDVGKEDDTPQNRALIKATIEAMGGTNVRFIRHGGTGDHLHVDWQMVRGRDARAEETDFSQEQRIMQQQLDQQLQQEVKLAQNEVRAKKRKVTAMENSVDSAVTAADVAERTAGIEQAFREYITASERLARAEAAKQKMDPVETQAYLQDTFDRLNAEWKETVRKNAETIGKVMDKFLADREKIIQQEYDKALQNVRVNQARQEGILTGMNLPENAGRIPEYTKVIQQHRIDVANSQTRSATYAANEDAIRKYREEITNLGMIWSANQDAASREASWKTYAANVEAVTAKIKALEQEQANLAAQNEALGQAPQNWGEAAGQAAQAWQIQNQGGISMQTRLFGQLGNAIEMVHGNFQQFFVDVLSGTKSIGKAFGDMAKAIIAALMEMLAKVIATQIFSMILGVAFPGVSLGSGGTSITGMPFNQGGLVPMSGSGDNWLRGLGMPKSYFKGGQVKKYASGGLINAGIPTRDTVPALLSKGEFVLRRSAVEDMGHAMLMDINNRGAAALDKMKTPIIMNGGGGQPVETNVYVVLPEEKPQLGPNDVLAVVTNDVLRGGATRSLIKQVARNG
jgi:TP901 family phage tail tape measure protein